MAIAPLVEEGAISLDDDIRSYIPELPEQPCGGELEVVFRDLSGLDPGDGHRKTQAKKVVLLEQKLLQVDPLVEGQPQPHLQGPVVLDPDVHRHGSIRLRLVGDLGPLDEHPAPEDPRRLFQEKWIETGSFFEKELA